MVKEFIYDKIYSNLDFMSKTLDELQNQNIEVQSYLVSQLNKPDSFVKSVEHTLDSLSDLFDTCLERIDVLKSLSYEK